MDLSRRPAEHVSELCTRFRSADLKAEGVDIGAGERRAWLVASSEGGT